MLKKYMLNGIIFIAAAIIVVGYLLSGCLSSYDERSAVTPALYFEKDSKSVVFTIIKYGKATSYKSDGASTTKRLRTNYFIQANDAETGEVIANKKIKNNSDIKFHPVTVMEAGNGKAWVFIGELLAFDPVTLEKFADKEIIEARNPQLKGKMPDEKNYYAYNNITNEIIITATDGLKYVLSTATLSATATDDETIVKNPVELKIKDLQKQQKILEEQYRAKHDDFSAFNKLYMEKKISSNAYADSTKNFNGQKDSIRAKQNEARNELADLKDVERFANDRQRHIDDLNRGNKSYTAICTAVDTMNGKWYGLLSNVESEKPDSRFRYRAVNKETDRNKLYSAFVTVKDSTRKTVELIVSEPEKINEAVYLQGGFLLNKTNALPIHLKNDDGFIICYREKVGADGNIILARVDLKGNAKWTLNTKLTGFADWIYSGKRLIILGNDNKEISSNDVNLLMSVDLQNGKIIMHDYFTNKIRKE